MWRFFEKTVPSSLLTRCPCNGAHAVGREDAIMTQRGRWVHRRARLGKHTLLGWTLRYGLAVVAVAAAFGLRVVLTTWVGPSLATYITFYPAVMIVALLAGFGPGVLATVSAGFVTGYCILPPVGEFAIASPADRLGLAIFTGMGVFMSVIADLYRRGRSKAAAYDREVALRASREALRESQDRYRNLFNKIDEGFCIVEVIFDAEDKPVDYRFLEVNAAFEKQTGLHQAQGKTMRQLSPAHEAHWFEIYGKVALTGEPARFVNVARALNRWFDVYAYRVGRPEDGKSRSFSATSARTSRPRPPCGRSRRSSPTRSASHTSEVALDAKTDVTTAPTNCSAFMALIRRPSRCPISRRSGDSATPWRLGARERSRPMGCADGTRLRTGRAGDPRRRPDMDHHPR